MKITVNSKAKTPPLTYPCLLEAVSNAGRIVLFTEPSWGTLVAESPFASSDYQPGYWSNHWDMGGFAPFLGTLTLEN